MKNPFNIHLAVGGSFGSVERFDLAVVPPHSRMIDVQRGAGEDRVLVRGSRARCKRRQGEHGYRGAGRESGLVRLSRGSNPVSWVDPCVGVGVLPVLV